MPAWLLRILTHPVPTFLVPYTVLLVFVGLGDSVLQVDEGADTFVSTTVLKTGLPRHSDGLNSTMPYADVYDGLFVYRTWVPYYLQALSLAGLGSTTFAARLPFALAGLASVAGLYFLTLKITGRRFTAFLAALFLASSVPALLYFRTARYVALPILWTLPLLYFYLKIFEPKKWDHRPFTVTCILYFHTMYVEFAGILLGLLLHLFLHRKSVSRDSFRAVGRSALIVGVFTLPWLAALVPLVSRISEFYTSASPLVDTSGWGLLKHLGGFLFQINNYIFPFILIPFLLWRFPRGLGREVQLLGLCVGTVLLTASVHSIPLQQYIAGAFPLLFMLLAILVTSSLPGGAAVKLGITAVLIGSNLVHVGPLTPLRSLFPPPVEGQEKNTYLEYAYDTFIRETALTSVYRQHWIQLIHPYQGPLDHVVDFFKTRPVEGETAYIDNEPESLAFYTGLKMIPNHQLSRDQAPDWIVLRGDQHPRHRAGPESPVSQILEHLLGTHPYEEIQQDAPVWRINNSYDIQLHRFESPETPENILIFRLRGREPENSTESMNRS